MAFDTTTYVPAPVEIDEVGKIILKARELLSDPAKWCKASFRKGAAVCVLGAIGYSDLPGSPDPTPHQEDAAMRLADLINPTAADFVETVFNYNDELSTTHADILALLDRAARASTPSTGDVS